MKALPQKSLWIHDRIAEELITKGCNNKNQFKCLLKDARERHEIIGLLKAK